MRTRSFSRVPVLGGLIAAATAFPAAAHAAPGDEFRPDAEFATEEPLIGPEIVIGGINMSITKGVFYILLATVITIGFMWWISKRMSAEKPTRVQAGVEWMYDFVGSAIVRTNIDDKQLAARWFPLIATLFIFIYVSNLIGYIPLPVNQVHPMEIFGVEVPSLAIYSATANISLPLVLAAMVWIIYNVEGVRRRGFVGYLKSLAPTDGIPVAIVPLLYVIEVLSHFVRLISLSLRLFANILAGHLLILFMAGGLVILLQPGILGATVLGLTTGVVGVIFFLFEIVLVAGLQAFIFAMLTAIYIGGAVAEEH